MICASQSNASAQLSLFALDILDICRDVESRLPTMSEERYSPSSWDNGDGSEAHHSAQPHNGYSRQPLTQGPVVVSRESLDIVPPTPTKSISPPRSSADSPSRPSGSKWRDSALPAPVTAELPDNVTLDSATLVEPSFDENVLRALCDMDVRLFLCITCM